MLRLPIPQTHLHTQEQRVQVKYNIYSIQWHTHVHTMHMCVHAHALLYTCIPTYAHTPTWRINENCRIIVSKWNGYCEACREENAFTNQNPQDRWHNDATLPFICMHGLDIHWLCIYSSSLTSYLLCCRNVIITCWVEGSVLFVVH